MHGEYKMPGGKLIVADLVVAQGQLAQVRISGDFFLEPDSALDIINQALTGLSATADEEVLAQAVSMATAEGVAMYGISAQAVAVAVRRALESHSLENQA